MTVKKAYKVVRVRNGKLSSAIVTLDPIPPSVAGGLYSKAHLFRFHQSYFVRFEPF
jgi:hypothetical protein